MQQRFAPGLVLLAGALWGGIGIFTRHFNALGLDAMGIGWLRAFVGLVTVGVFLLLFHRELLRIRLRDLWCFLGTGVGSLFLLNLTYCNAMAHTTLAVAGVLLYTAPIFVMIMSIVLFRETITFPKVLALILAIGGCAMVSGIGTDSHASATGILWGIGAGISYAMYSIYSRYAIRRGYGSWTIIFYSFLFCWIAHSMTCQWQVMGETLSQPKELVWAVALGVFTAFLPYLFYSFGLEAMEGSRASILASVEPVAATLVGVLIFQESLALRGVVGILLVLAAIVVLFIQKKGNRV